MAGANPSIRRLRREANRSTLDTHSTAPDALCSALPAVLALPERLDYGFEGFSEDAFAALDRLRQDPHIERYREEKEALDRYVIKPFRQYRDDLAVNFVLPNRLPFETERGVFSRLLKNDFGAGGAHHHLWMAFYRPPRRRLTDVQLSHSLYPDRFAFGLYVGSYAKALFRAAKQRLIGHPAEALTLFNPLLENGYTFAYARTVTKNSADPTCDAPLDALPDDLGRANGMWVGTSIPREEVLAMGPRLIDTALEAQAALWPLYRWLATAEGEKPEE